MKQIDTYINERLKINKDSGKKYNYHPDDSYQLRNLIERLLKERGPDANLNDIDVSKVTNMASMFKGLDIHNIDISEWDVSKVTTFESMFYMCKEFNCDISRWDISSAENTSLMFFRCEKLNCDLSGWNIKENATTGFMFYLCKSMKNEYLCK